MADFEGIPALGHSFVDEVDDAQEQLCSDTIDGQQDGGDSPSAKYRFNGRHIYVTWSKSTIQSKHEFHEKLIAGLPAGVRIFGGRELHHDGTPHYHAVFSFSEKVHWADARKQFSICGNTNAIHFQQPKPRQGIVAFLENTMAYCAKDGDTFGERLPLDGPSSERKKRTTATGLIFVPSPW